MRKTLGAVSVTLFVLCFVASAMAVEFPTSRPQASGTKHAANAYENDASGMTLTTTYVSGFGVLAEAYNNTDAIAYFTDQYANVVPVNLDGYQICFLTLTFSNGALYGCPCYCPGSYSWIFLGTL